MGSALAEPETATIDLDNLVERVPGLVALYNVQSGEYVFVNKTVERILGYKAPDFMENGISFAATLVHPDDAERIHRQNELGLKKANAARKTRSDEEPIMSFEYRMRHADGHWVWLQTEGSVYGRDERGMVELVLNVSVDITERKAAEQELLARSRELEKRLEDHAERLELALEASKMGTWEWNVETGALIWSPEMMRLYGMDPEHDIVTYEKFIHALHPDDREMKQRLLGHAAETGEPYQVEHRCVWPDGSMHWILGQGKAYMKNGKAYRMVGTAMNIDERKMTESALEASQLRYKTLFDSNIGGVFIADLSGRIIEANDTFLTMLGYQRKDVNKRTIHWDEITPADHKKTDQQKFRELFRKGEASPWKKEYVRKDGSRVPVMVGLVRLPKSSNLCIALVIDITEQEELAALNKAKDEFISLASHQLRTPATGVKQYIGMVMEGLVGDVSEEQVIMLEKAFESNERQLKIVNDLLLVARVDAGRVTFAKQAINIVQLVKDVIQEQKAEFAKRQQTIRLEAPRSLQADIDPHYIRMVLENIISNAGKYSFREKPVIIKVKKIGGSIRVDVTDKGVGISETDSTKLFQKFIRIDNPLSAEVGGSGLGLYWSKKIIDTHGGSIRVKSKPKEGTTFIISLPAY